MWKVWHKATVYFTCVKHILWLIVIPNMNKITLFSKIYHNKHVQFMKNVAIITQIWYGPKRYFTCISNTLYLITVPNINTINAFFSDTTNTQNVWQSGQNYSNLAKSQMLFNIHEQWMAPDYWTKYKNHNILLWDITNTQKLWTNCQNYSNVAQGQILFYMHWQPMALIIVTNIKKIHLAIKEECERMIRWIDWWTSPIPTFPNSAIAEQGIIK